MDKMESKILDIFEHTTGNIYDIYYIILKEYILKSETPDEIFKFVLEESQNHQFTEDDNSEYFAEEFIEEILSVYGEFLAGYMNIIVRENLPVEEFYKKLYTYVFEGDIFPEDDKSRAILLYFLAENNKYVPYFQMNSTVYIGPEKYRNIVDKLDPQIRKMFFVLNRQVRIRPEEASYLFDIIEELDNKEDKIVLLAVLINIIRKYAEEGS